MLFDDDDDDDDDDKLTTGESKNDKTPDVINPSADHHQSSHSNNDRPSSTDDNDNEDDDEPLEEFEEGDSEFVTRQDTMKHYCLRTGTLEVCQYVERCPILVIVVRGSPCDCIVSSGREIRSAPKCCTAQPRPVLAIASSMARPARPLRSSTTTECVQAPNLPRCVVVDFVRQVGHVHCVPLLDVLVRGFRPVIPSHSATHERNSHTGSPRNKQPTRRT
jgi:hypothetical protein